MTPQQLAAQLELVLSDDLGTYTAGKEKLPRGPAIFVGHPPSDYRATGLEVIVDPNGEFDNRSLHTSTLVVTEIPVRFIQHGPDPIRAAVIRACQALNLTNPTSIPPNEQLGILAQYVARARR